MSIKKVKQFTVKRNKWLRGEGAENSSLLREHDGKMCCLGFYSLACGLKPEDITLKDQISDLPIHWDAEENVVYIEPDCAKDMMCINDDEYISDEEREEQLINIFASEGITITFED